MGGKHGTLVQDFDYTYWYSPSYYARAWVIFFLLVFTIIGFQPIVHITLPGMSIASDYVTDARALQSTRPVFYFTRPGAAYRSFFHNYDILPWNLYWETEITTPAPLALSPRHKFWWPRNPNKYKTYQKLVSAGFQPVELPRSILHDAVLMMHTIEEKILNAKGMSLELPENLGPLIFKYNAAVARIYSIELDSLLLQVQKLCAKQNLPIWWKKFY